MKDGTHTYIMNILEFIIGYEMNLHEIAEILGNWDEKACKERKYYCHYYYSCSELEKMYGMDFDNKII